MPATLDIVRLRLRGWATRPVRTGFEIVPRVRDAGSVPVTTAATKPTDDFVVTCALRVSPFIFVFVFDATNCTVGTPLATVRGVLDQPEATTEVDGIQTS